METQEEIKRILKRIKGDWFEEEEFLISGGFISSFELIKLINEIEKEFEVKIPLERIEPEQFNSINNIIELIDSL